MARQENRTPQRERVDRARLMVSMNGSLLGYIAGHIAIKILFGEFYLAILTGTLVGAPIGGVVSWLIFEGIRGKVNGQLAVYLGATLLLYISLSMNGLLEFAILPEFADSSSQLRVSAVARVVDIIRILPLWIAPIIGGVCADCFDRRKLLTIVTLVFAALLIAVGALNILTTISLPFFYVFVLAASVVTMFLAPVQISLVTNLMRRDAIVAAIAFNTAALAFAIWIGGILGNALIRPLGLDCRGRLRLHGGRRPGHSSWLQLNCARRHQNGKD